ncbi:MAG: hypothetical protein KBT63_10175 [Porticoccaceae bacterium]|nr:hypothetical protein [Porticoccaceae bacterium]
MPKHFNFTSMFSLIFGLALATSVAANDQDDTTTLKEVLAETAVGAVFGAEEQRVLGEYLRHKRTQRDRDESSDRQYSDRRDDNEPTYSQAKQYRDNFSGKGKRRVKKLPPGLRKKLARGGELPPGWQKKVDRGEVLDDDIYQHAYPLPENIIDRVRRIEGTTVRQIDDRIVRVQDATRTVLDVFYLMQGAR